jgi:predicted FMN-binding regulatory protein PaiB
MEGKWKMSQNQPPANREATAEAFERLERDDISRMVRGQR